MHSSSSNESQEHATINDSDALAHDVSFFDKPKNVKIILNSFYALCLLLVILDFVVHRHIYLSFEEIPTFYALYGFVACVLLVVLAKLMRLVLMRGEHYYDERLDEDQQPEIFDTPYASTTENSEPNIDGLDSGSHSTSGDNK